MNNTTPNAFDSFNGSYDASGEFVKTIKIPQKTITSNGQAVVLKPDKLVTRKDISSTDTYAILEIVEHGNQYYDSMANEPLSDVSQDDHLTRIITGFDASLKRDVRVITMHDEGYKKASDTDKEKTIAFYRKYIATCGYDNTGSCDLIHHRETEEKSSGRRRPQTLGNGILKP